MCVCEGKREHVQKLEFYFIVTMTTDKRKCSIFRVCVTHPNRSSFSIAAAAAEEEVNTIQLQMERKGKILFRFWRQSVAMNCIRSLICDSVYWFLWMEWMEYCRILVFFLSFFRQCLHGLNSGSTCILYAYSMFFEPPNEHEPWAVRQSV